LALCGGYLHHFTLLKIVLATEFFREILATTIPYSRFLCEGASLMNLLKAIKPTVLKATSTTWPSPTSEGVPDEYKFNLKPQDLPLLARSIAKDEFNPSFYKVQLKEPINGFYEWYAFIDHVEQRNPPNNWIVTTESTKIKRKPISSDELEDSDKFVMPFQAQPLLANWVKDRGTHYEFELLTPHNEISNWFAFKKHVKVEGSPLLVSAG
jgi:hypothetical protein